MQNESVKNQRGNALLAALALSAFVAVIATEIYRRADVTAMRSQQAQFKDETKVIIEAFASNLQNPESCTRMLFDQTIIPGAQTPVTLNYKYEQPSFNPAETTIADEVEVTNGIVAHTVEVFAQGVPELTTRVFQEPTLLRRYKASLRTTWRSKNIGKLAIVNWSTDVIGTELGLPFYVWVDDANRIKTCFGVNSAGTVCNMALGYYYVAPPGSPPLAHQFSCRQTGAMSTDPTGANPRGGCRFVGPRPNGTCPPDAFTAPGGQGYSCMGGATATGPFGFSFGMGDPCLMQDATPFGIYTPMNYCVQCD